MTAFTIGYEGATTEALVAALRGAGVQRVIDVRALPLSLAAVYDAQLDLPEAHVAAAERLALADEPPSVSSCYERDPCHCHRTLLLRAVGEGRAVIDLYA